MKSLTLVFGLMCVTLGTVLVVREYSARSTAARALAAETVLNSYSNQVAEARAQLAEQEKLAAFLQTNLTQRTTELTALSTELTAASNSLQSGAVALANAQNQARTAQAENQQLTSQLQRVEGERDGLQTKLNELASKINNLDEQIAETRRKLAASEGDREFLTKELTRLQVDKSDLVRQFNNVAAVRAQLALLKEEAALNQRLAWMAQGVYQRSSQKGAQALMSRPIASSVSSRPSLDVELYQNATNSPVATPGVANP